MKKVGAQHRKSLIFLSKSLLRVVVVVAKVAYMIEVYGENSEIDLKPHVAVIEDIPFF